GHRRRPAPLRAAGSAAHAVPRRGRSANRTSQGRPRPSSMMSLAQIRGVREGGGRRARGVRFLSERPMVFRGPAAPWSEADAVGGKLAPIVEGQFHEDNRPRGIVLVRQASDRGFYGPRLAAAKERGGRRLAA